MAFFKCEVTESMIGGSSLTQVITDAVITPLTPDEAIDVYNHCPTRTFDYLGAFPDKEFTDA